MKSHTVVVWEERKVWVPLEMMGGVAVVETDMRAAIQVEIRREDKEP
jgi:hypothetical protein